MTIDEHTPEGLHEAVRLFNATLPEMPLRRAECLLVVAGDPPHRSLQHELTDTLRAADLKALAREVERTPIPRDCVLVVCVGVEVRVFVAPLTDLHGDDEPAPHGASALAVLGASIGGGR